MKNFRKSRGYWTKQRCIEDAKLYTRRSDWQILSNKAYKAAYKKGFLEECCVHMEHVYHIDGYWTKERCIEDAKLYDNRTAWHKSSPSARGSARINGWHEECCAHMERMGNIALRALYVFEHNDKSVYVGLSCNPDNRYKEHMRNHKILIEKNKLGEQTFINFGVFYSKDKASQKEIELVEKYRNNGWIILNKAKPGGLGGGFLIWTKKACIESARKYKTRSEWERNASGAYYAAHKNNWTKECYAHMGPSKNIKKTK